MPPSRDRVPGAPRGSEPVTEFVISDLRFAIYCDCRFAACPSQSVNGQSQIAHHKSQMERSPPRRENPGGPDVKLNIEIVGVVADSVYEGPRQGVRRQVFVPKWGRGSAAFYVRTMTRSDNSYALIRSVVKGLDASMPVYHMKTLERQLDETLLTDRLIALLSAGFGLLATVLASIGLYGVMAFVVARRRKELGIRLALGAQRGSVIWLVMREVIVLTSIGFAIGIPAALALGRYVAAQLYGIPPHDPLMAGAAVILLTIVSALAALIPAQSASRIDPILALRYE